MDIPLNAGVYCADGMCGHSTCIIINPITKDVTHFVVQAPGFLHLDYIVPLEFITESSPAEIHLRCTRDELALLEPFRRAEFIAVDDPVMMPDLYDMGLDDAYMWPYVQAEDGSWGVYADVEQIRPGDLSIHRGARVEATDGRIGRVDEFLVNPTNNHITHLVLREGHLWGQKDVTIPVSEIDHLEDDAVYLRLNKQQVQKLPGVPIERWWRADTEKAGTKGS